MSATESLSSASADRPVTIVTQTRVRPEDAVAFANWQAGTSKVVAAFPGFIKQTVMPPSPPAQVDWVILQRFANLGAASGWLNSQERSRRITGVEAMLVGGDDVHIVRDGEAGVLPAPVSAVISTRIKPGQETAYRAWEQRIAAAQSRAPGFQGYRFEPPLPGVQDDWLAILRFDTEANLQAWLDSSERHRLLEEAKAFTEEYHARIVRTGFEQWFPLPAGATAVPPAYRSFRADTVSERACRAPLRHRAVHRQCRQRPSAELSRAVGKQPVWVVAAARRRASAARRDRRRDRACCALRPDGACLLATVLAPLEPKKITVPTLMRGEHDGIAATGGAHSRA